MFLTTHLPPPCWFTAIEHGRKHAGTKEQRAREWGRLRAQGVKPGLGDMLILAPGFALWIELKAGANDTTDQQDVFGNTMRAMGHGYAVARSVEHLGEALERNNVPIAAGWRVKAQIHDMALHAVAPFTKKPARPTKPRATKPTRKDVARGNAASLMGARR